MSQTIEDRLQVVPTPAEVECDVVLANAGLHPRWIPTECSPQLAEAGAEIRDIIEKDGSITRKQEKATLDMAVLLGKEMYGDVTGASGRTKNYRATKAVERLIGNCMAFHEIAAGYLSFLGLGSTVVGEWQSFDRGNYQHATTGIVVKDFAVRFDGFSAIHHRNLAEKEHKEAEDSKPSASKIWRPEIIDAFLRATTTHEATIYWDVICKDDELWDGTSHPDANKLINAYVEPGAEGVGIIMPGATAILFYSGVMIQNKDDSKYKQAQDALQDYMLRLEIPAAG